MTRIVAFSALDTFRADFNFYDRNFFDDDLLEDEYLDLGGRTYRDAYVVNGYDAPVDLVLSLMGNNLYETFRGEIAGTVNAIFEFTFSETPLWYADGFAVPIASFFRVISTAGNADDRALLQQILSGNDVINLSRASDRFESGAGNDLVRAAGGRDVIYGDAGNDLINGGSGADRLLGGSGADTIRGQGGVDTLYGETGNDLLTGGGGADRFLFRRGDGVDVIADFRPNVDDIVIDSGATRFGQLDFYRVGSSTVVEFADVEIVLRGTRPFELDSGDFIFV
ncbi:calcium-binding protein [Paracoccus spongiarum]|uniref:Calcium-binding protein n=1 Tax=Paracoccus spongiarum TaxID=3064387 RepID=A0ABT9JC46_9RHOB|nr:calcium-binding protein [Paracoccus sp. 2205BS29-5]MDP5306722.1 calcium-binding protein [Paracoccus sp. 2205BS29-5]